MNIKEILEKADKKEYQVDLMEEKLREIVTLLPKVEVFLCVLKDEDDWRPDPEIYTLYQDIVRWQVY